MKTTVWIIQDEWFGWYFCRAGWRANMKGVRQYPSKKMAEAKWKAHLSHSSWTEAKRPVKFIPLDIEIAS